MPEPLHLCLHCGLRDRARCAVNGVDIRHQQHCPENFWTDPDPMPRAGVRKPIPLEMLNERAALCAACPDQLEMIRSINGLAVDVVKCRRCSCAGVRLVDQCPVAKW